MDEGMDGRTGVVMAGGYCRYIGSWDNKTGFQFRVRISRTHSKMECVKKRRKLRKSLFQCQKLLSSFLSQYSFPNPDIEISNALARG
jgi:hypothetical protein